MSVRILRRIGSTPAERGSMSGQGCPDLILLESGDVAVIGRRASFGETAHIRAWARDNGSGIADEETVVIVPAALLADAKHDIPEE